MITFNTDKHGKYASKEGSKRKYYYTEDTEKETLTNNLSSKANNDVKDLQLSDLNLDRTISLFDRFNDNTAKVVVDNLLKMSKDSKEDITILINSVGGDVTSLWSIVDTMESIKNTINTVCLGEADSCGAVLLATGNRRYIGQNSTTMIHSASGFAFGKEKDIEDVLELIKKEDDKIINKLSSKTEQPINFLTNLMKNDVYLSASESIEMGIVDKVLITTEKDIENLGINKLRLNFKNSIDTILVNELDKKLKNKKDIQILQPEGVIQMTKDEIILNLKKEFDVDVVSLQNENKNLVLNLGNLTAEKEVLAQKVSVMELEAVKKEKEIIINSLIDNKKATQASLEVHKMVAEKFSLYDFKGYVEKLPVLNISTEPVGNTQAEDNADNQDEDDKAIKAELVKRKLPLTNENYAAIALELI